MHLNTRVVITFVSRKISLAFFLLELTLAESWPSRGRGPLVPPLSDVTSYPT